MERPQSDPHDLRNEDDAQHSDAPPVDQVRRDIEEDPSVNPPDETLDDVRGG
jgi:hypothetical protein